MHALPLQRFAVAAARAAALAAPRTALSLLSGTARVSRIIPIRAFAVTRRTAFATAVTRKKPAAKKTRASATSKSKSNSRTAKTNKGVRAKATKAKAKKPKSKRIVKAKKPAVKKKPRKVVTPEQKARVEVRILKKEALLNEPEKLPEYPWQLYLSNSMKGGILRGQDFANKMRELADSFKQLSAAEHEQYRAQAEQNKLANNAAYKAWVGSFPVADIFNANRARSRLSRVYNKKTLDDGSVVHIGKSLDPIQDDRIPKRPTHSYNRYFISRWASGELKGIPVTQAAKTVAAQWQQLSPTQRKPFADKAEAESLKYNSWIANIETKVKASKEKAAA